MTTKLAKEIARYLDHLMDASWLSALVARHGLPKVLDTCAALLSRGDREQIQGVLLFTRDLGQNINSWAEPIADDVRAAIPKVVLPVVRPLLYSSAHGIRVDAIYTLAKLCYRSEAKTLRHAFPFYLERDPLGLARLIEELRWLGDRRGARVRTTQMVQHDHFLIRWAGLHVLDKASPVIRRDEMRWWRTNLEILAKDRVTAIRAEAQYVLDERRRGKKSDKIARKQPQNLERERRRWLTDALRHARESRRRAPPVTFDDLENRFCNAMHIFNVDDYTIEQLSWFSALFGVQPFEDRSDWPELRKRPSEAAIIQKVLTATRGKESKR